MYRINQYFKAVVIAENLNAKVKEIEIHKICNGTATMCKPDIADDMIRVIREESDKAIKHLELLKAQYNEQ
jgi:hypothetical protein